MKWPLYFIIGVLLINSAGSNYCLKKVNKSNEEYKAMVKKSIAQTMEAMEQIDYCQSNFNALVEIVTKQKP